MFNSLKVVPAVVILLWAAGAQPGAAQTLPGYTLAWSDEFSLPNGSTPDARHWSYDLGGGGWGNAELQTYTSRTNNCRIENGALVIEAKKETFTGTDGIQRNYTSARLKTQGKRTWTYGRIEGRMKIPRGQGLWPAFWMLGANITSAGWPTCGEIDIMENIGAEPATVHGTIHGPGYSGGNSIGGDYPLPGGGAFADDFHVFAIDWETNRIRWYVDDQLYFTATPRSLPQGSQWVFNAPQFLILNVAVGGNWPGSPNASTVFPQRMTVDYIRVYSPTNVPACGGNVLSQPGFESSGFGQWAAYGAGFNTSLATSPVRTGTNSLKVFGQFNGGDNYSGVYQDVPCSPGDTFTGSGWMFTPANDKIGGANTAWIEVTFRDASGNMLNLHRSALVQSTSPADAWLHLPVTNQVDIASGTVIGYGTNLVAPGGTAFIRAQVVFRQLANASGAVYVDDLSLIRPGETDFPVPVNVAMSASQLVLTFSTVLGQPYQVQSSTSLAAPSWLPVMSLAGTGTSCTVTQAVTQVSRFFRVRRLCN